MIDYLDQKCCKEERVSVGLQLQTDKVHAGGEGMPEEPEVSLAVEKQ